MAIIISNIKTNLDDCDKTCLDIALSKLKLKQNQVKNIHISKQSLDARNKNKIVFVNTVVIELFDENQEIKLCNINQACKYYKNNKIEFVFGEEKINNPIVIAGFGPAGMFAGLVLSYYGYKPIILERGEPVEQRVIDIENFMNNRVFNENSNIQFGEGGAGTFSDGKLTTRISDPICNYVLNQFVLFGAPKEILYKAKPHIGTDKLRDTVKNIRNKIIENGGQVLFNTKLTDIVIKNNRLKQVVTNKNIINTENLILSIGHSARDTFEMLYNKGVFMESKPFSIGARIEHLQKDVDKSLYGKFAGHKNLPKGEYQLSYRKGNRGVYTFCMCPGGLVVPSNSTENRVVTNGMSEYSRDRINANSALVVSVDQNDFGKKPLDGIYFQDEIEKKAFEVSGRDYSAIGVDIGSFLNAHQGLNSKSVIPSYSLGVKENDFNDVLPNQVTDMMKLGLQNFSSKMKCFGLKDGILTGVETRTSSPVKITRNNENFNSINVLGLYPTGEGAGYAGGIMSAAVDGIKVARMIMSKYKKC